MYARSISGRTLTFGVSGKLIMNGLVMYDRESGSLWSQVVGQAVDGEFAGQELTIIPALQSTLGALAGRPPRHNGPEQEGPVHPRQLPRLL